MSDTKPTGVPYGKLLWEALQMGASEHADEAVRAECRRILDGYNDERDWALARRLWRFRA